MAEDPVNIPHPLVRGGTGRPQRNLPARMPQSFQLDARTEADLLEYLFQLSKVFVYHDLSLQKSDWQDFFSASLPFQLAHISHFDTGSLQQDFELTCLQFESGLSRGDLSPLFGQTFALARLLNRWYQTLPESSGLHQLLFSLLDEDLRFAFSKLFLLARNTERAQIGYKLNENLRPFQENPVWQFSTGLLGLTGTLKGASPIRRQTVLAQIKELFNTFMQGVERIKSASAGFLPESLGDHLPEGEALNHTAHTGLIFAFIKLFSYVQNNLNDLNRRHLDFYYRDVLGLKEKPAVPDSAHLVLELDKNAAQHLLKANTLFKGGKDKLKADVLFQLPQDVTLNRAAVDKVRTLYRQTGSNQSLAWWEAIVANSADGKGKPFDEPEKAAWKLLGSTIAADHKTDLPKAKTGFILASPALLLKEGNGQIGLLFSGSQAPDFSNAGNPFSVYYSGSKGWVGVTDIHWGQALDVNTGSLAANNHGIVVDIGADPFVFADAKTLGEDYGTTDPILKFIFSSPSTTFESSQFNEISLTVKATRVRNLLLSNDDGAVDNAKPFFPFSALPHLGSSFIIGCEEAFRKRLTQMSFHFSWDNLPASSFLDYYKGYDYKDLSTIPQNNDFQTIVGILNNDTWDENLNAGQQLVTNLFTYSSGTIPDQSKKIDINFSSGVKSPTPLKAPLVPYNADSKFGFVRMRLSGSDFRHAVYPQLLTLKTLELAEQHPFYNKLSLTSFFVNHAQNTIPGDFPQIATGADVTAANNNITAANDKINKNLNPGLIDSRQYIGWAKSTLDAANEVLHPLNAPYTPSIREFYISYTAEAKWTNKELLFAHVHPFEAGNHEKISHDIPSVQLLPDFPDEGSLYIGLKEILPGSNLSILFQLSEATANPDLPQADLQWAYLSGNRWKLLKPDIDILEDQTQRFITSGIVRIALPFDIGSADTTILPREDYWLRVSASKGIAAVSDAIALHAQAIKTTFKPDPGNDTARLSEPYAAKQIGKLEESDALVKKIGHPYDSFGGIPPEIPGEFYRRAGEQLRHKGRAIAIYDYERLVLEAFPEVFKAKCITHTFAKNASENYYAAPGHVTLAVIPDMRHFSSEAKIQPKASSILLRRIEAFIRSRISPFVRFKAVNPVFELLDVTLWVVFNAGKDQKFYENQLQSDLQRFLIPWAFGEEAQMEVLSFGGSMFRSSLIKFVESRDYVNYLTGFAWRRNDGTPFLPDQNTTSPDFIEATSERSILTAGNINIFARPDLACSPSNQSGQSEQIGHVSIGRIHLPQTIVEEPPCTK